MSAIDVYEFGARRWTRQRQQQLAANVAAGRWSLRIRIFVTRIARQQQQRARNGRAHERLLCDEASTRHMGMSLHVIECFCYVLVLSSSIYVSHFVS